MSDLCDGAREMLESYPEYDSSVLKFNDMDRDGIYSIYDSCTGVYCTPFVMENDNAALRCFSDYCIYPDTSLSKHPEDYSLYCLGDYNKKTGLLVSLNNPRLLAKASTFVYQAKLKSNKASVGTPDIPEEAGIAPAAPVSEIDDSSEDLDSYNDFISLVETQDIGGDEIA